MSKPFEESEISLSFDGTRAVVDVCGEIDLATAPTLGGILEALVESGHTDLVLDMAALGFFDAAGVRVLVRLLKLLQPRQGRLSLRSVPAHMQRVLDLTGVSALLDLAPLERAPRIRPRVEILAGDRVSQEAWQRRLGVSPTVNDTIDAALQRVVELASAAVRGADGVSVSLYRQGRLMTAVASDATVLEMDRDQYATGEGPCLSAAAEGHWIRTDALSDETRWPKFVPRAMEDGIAHPLVTTARRRPADGCAQHLLAR